MTRMILLLYRWLLRLYPPAFRQEFALEMENVFYDAAQEAGQAGLVRLVGVIGRELRDFPQDLLLRYWEEYKKGEGRMAENIPMIQTAPLASKRGSWAAALLAGLPFALDALHTYLGTDILQKIGIHLPRHILPGGGIAIDTVLFFPFYVLIFLGLWFGWRKVWPRWSATYIGFGALFFLEMSIYFFPQAVPGSILGLAWLAGFVTILFFVGRREVLQGFIALMPFLPMFIYSTALDGVIGSDYEITAYLIAGVTMAAAVFLAVRIGSSWAGAALLMCATIGTGGLVGYGTVYLPNSLNPPEPSPLLVARGAFLYAVWVLIFTIPVWLPGLWRKIRPFFQRGRGPSSS